MVPKFSEIGRLLDRLFSFFSRRRSVVEEWTSDNGNEGDGGRPGGRDFRIFTKNGLILGYQKNCHTISGGDRF